MFFVSKQIHLNKYGDNQSEKKLKRNFANVDMSVKWSGFII